MYGYRGTTVLVTGASKGLGTAYARELAHRGARLVLVARSTEALEALATELRDRHRTEVEVIAADLGSRQGPEHVTTRLRERGITVDVLLNNAGMGTAGSFLTRPLAAQQASVDLNVSGLMALTHLLGADMVARGAGGVINVASTAAFQPLAYQASYAATKAFVLSFSEALAEELRGTGVRVMAAHPGATATGFFDGTTATMDPRFTDTPRSVAARTLDDFARGRAASYPGRPLNRVTTWIGRLVPRTWAARAGAAVNRRVGLHDVHDVAGAGH
ncbi:SDR family NAD(P)-dependent oxidoreductase [Actinoplanes sp. NPDC051494]|uniref:SDR family NAD(P)-dependent oxidoreductase n=1 Tax=Actinoplanes sp. NPDC051494 TaxID=3363907 RepID=UPI0037AC8A83